MTDFEFYSPTRILFGKGKETEAGRAVKAYADRALVVCSRGKTNATGVVDRVLASLSEAGVAYVELNGIKPNPVLSKVQEGIKLAKENGVKFILAVGGGSVIDTAKAIAMGVPYEGDVWDFFNGKTAEAILPVGCVLTFPAAGSEQSINSVITHEATHMKRAAYDERLRTEFVIENPELTLTLDKWQTFCGIADMMMHVFERYISRTSHTDFTDRLCEAMLNTEIANARILKSDLNNYDARAEIMLASTFSHNNLAGMGREQEWVVHGLSLTFGGFYDVTHGAALTAIVCSWMRYIMELALPRFVQMAVRLFNVEYDAADPARTAREGIDRLEDFFRSLGLPVTLKELGVPTDDAELSRIAEDYMKRGARGNIKRIEYGEALEILKMARG